MLDASRDMGYIPAHNPSMATGANPDGQHSYLGVTKREDVILYEPGVLSRVR